LLLTQNIDFRFLLGFHSLEVDVAAFVGEFRQSEVSAGQLYSVLLLNVCSQYVAEERKQIIVRFFFELFADVGVDDAVDDFAGVVFSLSRGYCCRSLL